MASPRRVAMLCVFVDQFVWLALDVSIILRPTVALFKRADLQGISHRDTTLCSFVDQLV